MWCCACHCRCVIRPTSLEVAQVLAHTPGGMTAAHWLHYSCFLLPYSRSGVRMGQPVVICQPVFHLALKGRQSPFINYVNVQGTAIKPRSILNRTSFHLSGIQHDPCLSVSVGFTSVTPPIVSKETLLSRPNNFPDDVAGHSTKLNRYLCLGRHLFRSKQDFSKSSTSASVTVVLSQGSTKYQV